MNKKKLACCWDLEGPISVIDFAAELGKKLSKKSDLNLYEYDMGEFFRMISNYDDYIIKMPGVKEKLNIPEYQPGDTLRLMAPLYASCFTDEDLINFTKNNLGLLPGCRELMKVLQKDWDIFIISTSYTHFAHNVTTTLEIPKDHVYCTDLNIQQLKKEISNIEESVNILIREIYEKYLANNKSLDSIIEDLNEFFWMGPESDYIRIMNQIEVRGGKRKELAVEEISERTGIPISEMIALGDSITDINMLQRLSDEGGISVSFNGNRFSVERANVALTTTNNLGALPLFQQKEAIKQFLEHWEICFKNFQNYPKNIPDDLISKECKEYFIKYNFIPEIINLTNKSKEQINDIISRQENMRKFMRGWASKLG
ncbi:MAG: HAD hydrolase family protein [Candidatus Hodarchaeota archaeon]